MISRAWALGIIHKLAPPPIPTISPWKFLCNRLMISDIVRLSKQDRHYMVRLLPMYTSLPLVTPAATVSLCLYFHWNYVWTTQFNIKHMGTYHWKGGGDIASRMGDISKFSQNREADEGIFTENYVTFKYMRSHHGFGMIFDKIGKWKQGENKLLKSFQNNLNTNKLMWSADWFCENKPTTCCDSWELM